MAILIKMTDFWINNTFQFTQFAAETMVYFEKHKLIEITKVQFFLYKTIQKQCIFGNYMRSNFYQSPENFS